MALRIVDNKILVRNGLLAMSPECCCCGCNGTEDLASDCGIDYIALELEICIETCRTEDVDPETQQFAYRSCPGDAWTVTLELRAADGFAASGYINTNQPAGQNDLLPLEDAEGEAFVLIIEAARFCGVEFAGNLAAVKQPIISDDVHWIQIRLVLNDVDINFRNCWEWQQVGVDQPPSFCRGSDGRSGQDYFFAFPLPSRKTDNGCCPGEPSFLPNFEYPELNSPYLIEPPIVGAFEPYLYEFCDGFVFKVNSVTIVYI